MNYKITLYFLLLFLLMLFFSCAAHKSPAPAYKQHIPPQQPQLQKQLPDIYHPRQILLENAIKSIGLPYKWGGISPETGFDCSGLIVYAYQKADIILPRTAKAQFNHGKIISKTNLHPGDLVFFRTPEKTKIFHVGIYIGNGRFIHAPGKGRKVTYGYLGNPYFKKHYIGSRSYL